MKKLIITIAREYGSGGREIGEAVAKRLNIPLYDKELIKEAAAKGSLSETVIAEADESATGSLLYTLAMGSNVLGTTMRFGYKMPLNDKLFILQSEVIREYAEEGSCVIIGRCADYVLRNEDNLLRIFVTGNIVNRQERIAKRHPDIPASKVIDAINKTDKRRASYYNFYTGNKWGGHNNYDLIINSSTLGIDGAVDVICECARKMREEK